MSLGLWFLVQMVPPSGQAKGMAAQCWGKVARRNLALHHSTACAAAQKDPLDRVGIALTHVTCIAIFPKAVWTVTVMTALQNFSYLIQESVEMYVATGNDRVAENSANMLRVAPPRSQNSSNSLASSSANGSSKRIVATDHTRALKAELRVTGSELRSKTAELSEAKQIIKYVPYAKCSMPVDFQHLVNPHLICV